MFNALIKNNTTKCVLVVSIMMAILAMITEVSTPLLEFNRHPIVDGQWWRLLTGNFIHTNVNHLVMNIAGLLLIFLMHKNYYTVTHFTFVFLFLCISCGVSLLTFYPNMILYVGLSGVLHGLLVYGSVIDIKQKEKTGWILLVGTFAKVAYENIWGASAQVSELINASVAVEAHLIGAVSGGVLAAMLIAKSRLQTQS